MARRAAVRPEAEGCLPSACGHLRPAGVSAVGTPGSREAGRPGCRPPFPGAGCDRGPRERSPGGPRAWPRLGSRAHPVGPRRAGPRSCSPFPCTCPGAVRAGRASVPRPGAAPTAGKRRCPRPLPLTCFQDRSRRGEGRRALRVAQPQRRRVAADDELVTRSPSNRTRCEELPTEGAGFVEST